MGQQWYTEMNTNPQDNKLKVSDTTKLTTIKMKNWFLVEIMKTDSPKDGR